MNVQAAAKHHHTSTISYLTGGLWDYVFRAAPAPQTLAASSYSNNENSTTFDVPSAAPSSVQSPARSLAGPTRAHRHAATSISDTSAAVARVVVRQQTATLPPSRAPQQQRQNTRAVTPVVAVATGHPLLVFDIDHDRRRRPSSSCDSIGNEMTHFKPIDLMPISTNNGSDGSAASASGCRRGSDSSDDVVVTACSGPVAAVGTAAACADVAAAAAETPMVMYVPKVRYATTGQTMFAPAKSKFKPESPQKLRLSAFCLVTKTTTLLEQQLFSAVAAELNRPAPPTKANTRQSRAAAAAASVATAGASSSNGATSSAATATYSVQHSAKSQQKMMCNIRLNKDNRDRILQERGDFELAKKLQQFDDEPRLTRPTKARSTTAVRGRRRKAPPTMEPPPATPAKRSRQSATAAKATKPARSSNGDSSLSSPQRYNLRHRRSNGMDDEPEPSSANGKATRNGVKRKSNGRRRV